MPYSADREQRTLSRLVGLLIRQVW